MKQFLSLLLLMLLCFLPLNAAAITSAQSGAYDATSTWVGGVIPGNGDTVIIANGHTVTINAGTTVTVGTSPAADGSEYAIQCSSGTGTGVLVVSGHLIYRGPILQCASTWTISPGAWITHDSSQAAVPSTANYRWRFNGAAAQTSAFLYAVGTPSSRITFDVAASSGNSGGFATYNDAGTDGSLFVEYADISYHGTSANPLYRGYPFNCSTSIVRGVTFRNTKIDHSGEIRIGPAGSSCTVDLYNVAISSPAAANAWTIATGSSWATAIGTNGFRRIENVFVDGGYTEIQAHATNDLDFGLKFKNNYLRGPTSSNPPFSGSGRLKSPSGYFDLNWIETRDPSAGGGASIPMGSVTRLMLATNDSSNAHISTTRGGTTAIDGGFSYNFLSGDKGDDVFQLTQLVSTGETNPTVEIKNFMTLPSPAGDLNIAVFNINPGTQCTGTNCVVFNIHNTNYFTGTGAGMGSDSAGLTFETRNGYAGQVAALINNIVWRQTSGAGYITNWSYTNQSVVNGVFTQADYNVSNNVTTSVKYASEAGAFAEYASTPGVHDQSLNPYFVDSTRNPITYGQRWDSTITTSDQLAAKFLACYQRMADGTTTCDPRFNLEDMYNWIRAGFRPRNPAVWTAASDGTHVGAVAPMKRFGVFAQ